MDDSGKYLPTFLGCLPSPLPPFAIATSTGVHTALRTAQFTIAWQEIIWVIQRSILIYGSISTDLDSSSKGSVDLYENDAQFLFDTLQVD